MSIKYNNDDESIISEETIDELIDNINNTDQINIRFADEYSTVKNIFENWLHDINKKI